MTHPDQYVYNPAFHLKMLCVILAGANIVVFYFTVFRRVSSLGPGAQGPMLARVNGAVSLALWVTVIICGRMITFYRPSVCGPGEAVGFLAECIVRKGVEPEDVEGCRQGRSVTRAASRSLSARRASGWP